jgi:hypothetical protein
MQHERYPKVRMYASVPVSTGWDERAFVATKRRWGSVAYVPGNPRCIYDGAPTVARIFDQNSTIGVHSCHWSL